jgi:hypothetical protein
MYKDLTDAALGMGGGLYIYSDKSLFENQAFNFNEEKTFETYWDFTDFSKNGFAEYHKLSSPYIGVCLDDNYVDRALDNCTFTSTVNFGETYVEFKKNSLTLRKLDSGELQVKADYKYKNDKQSIKAMVPEAYSSAKGFYAINYSICKKNDVKACIQDIEGYLTVPKSYFNVSNELDLRIPETLLEKDQEYTIKLYQKDIIVWNFLSENFTYNNMTEVESNEIEFSDLKLESESGDIVKISGMLVWNNPEKKGQAIPNVTEGVTINISNQEGLSIGKFEFGVIVPGKYGDPVPFSKKISMTKVEPGRRVTITMKHENAQSVSIIFEKKSDGTYSEYQDQSESVEAPKTVGGKIKLRNPLKTEFDSIPTIVTAVIQKIIIPLTIPFVVIMIIWSGFLLVKSQGNPGELKKAKNAIKWTFIGALVILASYVIAEAIQGTIVDMIGYVKNWYV